MKKIKNPDSESFDKKQHKKNQKDNGLEKFMELYKSKSKISIHQIKTLFKEK
jgi:hypothetical protein